MEENWCADGGGGGAAVTEGIAEAAAAFVELLFGIVVAAGDDPSRDWIVFIKMSTSVEKSTSFPPEESFSPLILLLEGEVGVSMFALAVTLAPLVAGSVTAVTAAAVGPGR